MSSAVAVLRPTPRRLCVIARNEPPLASFGPYVPSINDRGEVAFQATLSGGGTGVYIGSEALIEPVVEWRGTEAGSVVSHPDLSSDRGVCFYARGSPEDGGVLVVREGVTMRVAPSFGPLGPTMNDEGDIAFRALDPDGAERVCLWNPVGVRVLASVGGDIASFEGLPVVNRAGAVAYRATLRDRTQVIRVVDADATRTIASTGAELTELSCFPSMNDRGVVVFVGISGDGGADVLAHVPGQGAHLDRLESLASLADGFESLRGALVSSRGTVVVIGTRRAGSMGVHTGLGAADRVLCLGDPLFGSSIADFALNPVSMNSLDQLAIRVRLADSRELILRSDPCEGTYGDSSGVD